MDGELDVIIVSGLAKWKLLLLFLSVFFGKHTKFKEVQTFKGKRVVIHSTHQVPVHADGDTVGDVGENNELTVGVLPSSWKMLNKK